MSTRGDSAIATGYFTMMEAVFSIEQRVVNRRPIVVLAMIERDHAEERLARIDRILRQLERQPPSFEAIAAKLVNVVAHAAPSPALRAGATRVTLPARVEQKNDRRVSWRSRRIK